MMLQRLIFIIVLTASAACAHSGQKTTSGSDGAAGPQEEDHNAEVAHEKRFIEMEQRLDDRMLDRMNWQFGWFALLTGIFLTVASGAYILGFTLGYKKLRSRLEPIVKEYEDRLAKQRDAARDITSLSYESAIAILDACCKCSDDGKEGLGAARRRAAINELSARGTRLMILYGPDKDVMAGADDLSYSSSTPERDIEIVRRAMARPDLSPETNETLLRAHNKLIERAERPLDSDQQRKDTSKRGKKK